MENKPIVEENKNTEYELFLNKLYWDMVNAGVFQTNARTYIDMFRDMNNQQDGVFSFVLKIDRRMISDYVFMDNEVV